MSNHVQAEIVEEDRLVVEKFEPDDEFDCLSDLERILEQDIEKE